MTHAALFFPNSVSTLRGSCSNGVKAQCSIEAVSVAFGMFPSKFSHKMSLVTCPCAFRLRRLAQNGCRGLGVRHFS